MSSSAGIASMRWIRVVVAAAAVVSAVGAMATAEAAAAAPPAKPIVYLTFDDGPLSSGTTAVLDLLDRYDVDATFFVLGSRVVEQPALIARMLRDGHALGGHSWDHPDYSRSSDAAIASQLDRTADAVRSAGGPPLTCHRAPYGTSTTASRRLAAERGLAEIYWNIDPADYRNSASGIVGQLERVVNGSVVLLHDGSTNYRVTVAAVDRWLGANRDRYDFRPLPACSGGPPGPRSVHRPLGSVDTATAVAGGVKLAGWALDWDVPGTPTRVHVYVDGAFGGEFAASSRRPDVAAATGADARHGFAGFVPTPPGAHEVCVFGLGLDSAGRFDSRNAALGPCRNVRVGTSGHPGSGPTTPAPPPTPPSPTGSSVPRGYVDRVATTSEGLDVAGWALDPDDATRSVFVHVYVDGRFWAERRAASVRPDVNTALAVGGSHGFTVRGAVGPGRHDVCVYVLGIDRIGALDAMNPLLGCRTVAS
ncbi:MAG: polysaccharide deacetylase family protein [Acidimicrobiales bacterium]